MAAGCILGACQPPETVKSGEAALQQRQDIYGQLNQLELRYSNLTSEMPHAPDLNPPEIHLRKLRSMSPAQKEQSDMRRLIAMEELARLPAPEQSAI